MLKLFLMSAVAFVTAGCSPAMYGIPHRSVPPPYYAHPRGSVPQPVPTGRWDNVMRLPRGSTIDVLTQDGAPNIGRIAGADVQSVRLVIDGTEVRIARPDIIRVDLIDLAGSETAAIGRKAARGALLGAALATIFSGVVGGDYWPPPGHVLRAGAALGGVSAGQSETTNRSGRLIYLAPDQGGWRLVR